jgi:hypothetical protein
VKALRFNSAGNRLGIGGDEGQIAEISKEMSVANTIFVI